MTTASRLEPWRWQNNKEQAKKNCYSTSLHETALQKISALWLQGMIYLMPLMLSQVVLGCCCFVIPIFLKVGSENRGQVTWGMWTWENRNKWGRSDVGFLRGPTNQTSVCLCPAFVSHLFLCEVLSSAGNAFTITLTHKWLHLWRNMT